MGFQSIYPLKPSASCDVIVSEVDYERNYKRL